MRLIGQWEKTYKRYFGLNPKTQNYGWREELITQDP